MLHNQEGLWKSNDLWSFTFKEDLICIENINITGEFLKTNNVKRQQEYANSFFSDKNKKWKLDDNNMLKNKEGIWKSVDSWVFKPKDDDLIYIENTSKTKVLEATSDGRVIQEFSVEGKANQLWKKGKPDAEDYFTLENSGELKVLTAISESGLEIKGNIIMR